MNSKLYLFLILPVIGILTNRPNKDINLNINYNGKKTIIQINESQTINDLINLINTYYNINTDKIIFNKKILIRNKKIIDYKLMDYDELFVVTKTLF